MTAGMAFEGLNQAGETEKDLIVVLNDNAMSIAPNVGAFSSFISRKMTGKRFVNLKKDLENFIKSLPGVGENILKFVRKSEDSFITFFTPGMMFEAFKFKYIGPIQGHRIDLLIEAFTNASHLEGPVLVHALTVKVRGMSLLKRIRPTTTGSVHLRSPQVHLQRTDPSFRFRHPIPAYLVRPW